tara:strand:+ start:425 stop:1294 length:870 start_codon:yes stop_codon:yes gene_type:complete
MISEELLKNVQKLEINTRRIVQSTFSGNFQSAFRGQGLNFSDMRSYQVGDDIRNINWKASARSQTPYVNLFEEERELTVILMVDISGSGIFGSHYRTKLNFAAEMAAVLGFSAVQNSDKVGLLLFSDHVEAFIPPKKGKNHMLRILRDIFSHVPANKHTNLAEALRYVTQMIKKKSVLFLISDFLDHHYQHQFRIVAKKHDLVPIVIEDSCESSLPSVGTVAFQDQENDEIVYVNTSSQDVQKAYDNMQYARQLEQNRIFKSSNCEFLRLDINHDYIAPLIQFFNKRLK